MHFNYNYIHKYTQFIDSKLKETENIKQELEEKAGTEHVPTKLADQKIKKFLGTFYFIKETLNKINIIKESKMADLNLELAMKIIPIPNGSHKDVAPFFK